MARKLFSLILFQCELLVYILLFNVIEFGYYKRLAFLWFGLVLFSGHYNIRGNLIWDEMKSLLKVTFMFFVISIAIIFPDTEYIADILILGSVMLVVSIVFDRTLRVIFRDTLASRTLVIGTNSEAYRVAGISKVNRFALTKIRGNIHLDGDEIYEEFDNDEKKDVFEFSEIEEVIKRRRINQIIVCDENSRLSDDDLSRISRLVSEVKIAPNLSHFQITFDSVIEDYDGILMISTRNKVESKIISRILKRIIDICAGIAGCIILLPLSLWVSHTNKKNGDEDPIFFTQERVGKDGKTFKVYKYRTMVPDAEKILEELMASDPAIKEEYLTNKKLKNDPRVTTAGSFLRRTSLDEFPQFINVLKGEMSFIGPRPYLIREIEDMGEYYDSIIQVKPGISGMWQASGRSDLTFKDRCRLDEYYYHNWDIYLDLVIIYKTVKSVIYGKGAI